MGEIRVSASEFRVHLKTLANGVARGGDPVVFERHGFPMAAMINLAEYEEFCRWRAKTGRAPAPPPEEHPDNMTTEEVQQLYETSKHSIDDAWLRWRWRAYNTLASRRRAPAEPPS